MADSIALIAVGRTVALKRRALTAYASASVARNSTAVDQFVLLRLWWHRDISGEVISCLDESQPEVDLESIKIRLDFLCLTLPPDVEKLAPGDARLSSSSIMFDSEKQRQDEDAESNASIGYHLEVPRDPLHHLPEFQNEVISRCIEKLKWMLKDEMASAALNSFPLTAEALHMVAEHVRSTAEARTTTRLHATTGAPGCQVQKVPLQFVFGPEQSFGKFLQEFKHLTLPGYQLEQVDKDHYCVVLDDKDSKVVRRPFGSLVPPLGLRSKALEMTTALPHEKAGADAAETRGSLQKSIGPDAKLSDEDESGDGGVPQTSFRAWRRQTGKSARTKSAERRLERASSLPLDSLVTSEEPKPEVRVPGASCPLELLDLRRKLQEEAGAPEANSATADHGAILSSETIVQEQKAAENQEPAEAPVELAEESGSSEQQDGGFRDRTDSLASSLGHGMAFRPPQHLLESTRSTPNALSEVGGQISNTEDGYDGDSSESDSDRDWMNALETQRSHLPPFWMILCPFLDHVDIFFHVREQSGESTELRQGLVVFESIVALIQDTCKIVNQILLLQHLNNTRICNRLLVPEATEDIWNRESEIEQNSSIVSVYGLQALRAVLTGFSGFTKCLVMDDMAVLKMTCHSQEFRPRLSSGHSDRDQSHDTVSVTSHASGSRNKPHQCVVMNVHGIVQPGFAIKEELVSVMQNRLDDAVLEVLTTTLARNPACNLTIDDVQFIQKPQKEPTTQLYCTVQAQLLPYLQALMEYLRQDLHTFLPTPKYTDPKPENHFKLVGISGVAVAFVAQQEPTKGIACIILSVVDAQGRPVQFLNSPLPKVGAFSGTEPPTEYQEVSFLSREEVGDAGADGTPAPSIQRVVWEQVSEALPAAHAPPVAAPLTYAEALNGTRRPLVANGHAYLARTPTSTRSFVIPTEPMYQAVRPFSRPPPSRFQNPWRTQYSRPICFACGIVGHVARFCRRREFFLRDDVRPNNYAFPQRPEPAVSGETVTMDTFSPHRNFNRHRSPSPQRRSLSPMLRRPRPVPEEN
ncbi:hypothetical protein HPB51_003730 [Rhipicephalus microplus]|uniref:CCHC-type domain-containing protein n=1 Tax=Rhipicephalus microplus TaxID=6941 RepID=A0A9J6ELN5_RHIMP|nr:hypothetical protein HPB51_003730 [Rhipicephalus microplus]